MSSTLAQGAAGVPNYLSGSSPSRLERRVLSEERGKSYSSRPFCGALDPAGGREAVGCRIHADWDLGTRPRVIDKQ